MTMGKSQKRSTSGWIDNVCNVFYLVEADVSSKMKRGSLRAKENSHSATSAHNKRQVKRKLSPRDQDVPCDNCHVKGTVFSLIM